MLIKWTHGLALTAVLVWILSVAFGYCQSEGTPFAKATGGLTICTVQLIEELIALAKYSHHFGNAAYFCMCQISCNRMVDELFYVCLTLRFVGE